MVRSAEANSFRPTLAPGTTVGGYAVVRRIGAGGLGVVYEARHQRLDKPVAVKTLHAELAADPNVRERFLREGQAAARLRHPNVVDVWDVAIDGEHPYLVMELLKGEELGALIERESPINVKRTMDLLLPVVSALALAHQFGIVHRDLKPQNVFLSQTPTGFVVPKVVDFGISKFLDNGALDLTRSNSFLGTPHYMSPEQARGSKLVDCRSDQFSLAVIAYECLTGMRPFLGDSFFALLSAVIHHEPPPVHELNPAVSLELSAVISRMMAKSPDDRFDTIRSVGTAFLPFASRRVQLDLERDFRSPNLSAAVESAESTCTDTSSKVERLWRTWELGRPARASIGRRELLAAAIGLGCAILLAWVLLFRTRELESGKVVDLSSASRQPPQPSSALKAHAGSLEPQLCGTAEPDAVAAGGTAEQVVSSMARSALRESARPPHRGSNSVPNSREARPNPTVTSAPAESVPARGANGALILP